MNQILQPKASVFGEKKMSVNPVAAVFNKEGLFDVLGGLNEEYLSQFPE